MISMPGYLAKSAFLNRVISLRIWDLFGIRLASAHSRVLSESFFKVDSGVPIIKDDFHRHRAESAFLRGFVAAIAKKWLGTAAQEFHVFDARQCVFNKAEGFDRIVVFFLGL